MGPLEAVLDIEGVAGGERVPPELLGWYSLWFLQRDCSNEKRYLRKLDHRDQFPSSTPLPDPVLVLR